MIADFSECRSQGSSRQVPSCPDCGPEDPALFPGLPPESPHNTPYPYKLDAQKRAVELLRLSQIFDGIVELFDPLIHEKLLLLSDYCLCCTCLDGAEPGC